MGRRHQVVFVPFQNLGGLLSGAYEPINLPADVMCDAALIDIERDGVLFRLSHPSFTELADNQPAPEISLLCRHRQSPVDKLSAVGSQ